MKEGRINELMELIIKDSNQFHAVCYDTYTSLLYLTDFSQNIINLITHINRFSNLKIGYTFNAGPHAILLVHKQIFEDFFKLILNITQVKNDWLVFLYKKQ